MRDFTLRPYAPADEDAAIDLWLRTWQLAYPAIDFTKRVAWWRERWRNELVPQAAIIVAEHDGALTGFVTIDAGGYLDQLVVGRRGADAQIGRHVVRRPMDGGDVFLLEQREDVRNAFLRLFPPSSAQLMMAEEEEKTSRNIKR